jgi:hypothetical protein
MVADEFPESDADDSDFYDCDDDDEFETFYCHMNTRGECGLAGTEECDWECPFNRRGLGRLRSSDGPGARGPVEE